MLLANDLDIERMYQQARELARQSGLAIQRESLTKRAQIPCICPSLLEA